MTSFTVTAKVADATGANASATAQATVGGITHGRQINASNTGLNYNGINPSTLTPVSGPQEYSTPGQVISGKSFNNTVYISGDNITIRNCKILYGGDASFGVSIQANNVTVEGCLITAPTGQSLYEPIAIDGSTTGATIHRCDISRGAQFITTNAFNVTIIENYMHDCATDSDRTQHPDGIEVFGSQNTVIARNWLSMGTDPNVSYYDGVVDIGAIPNDMHPNVAGCTVEDNYLQGGQEIILTDNTHDTAGKITNLIVRRNDMDQLTDAGSGQQYFGPGHALLDYDGHPIVQTAAAQAANPFAILWPTSGPDANHWVNPSNISPSWAGLTVVPPQGHG